MASGSGAAAIPPASTVDLIRPCTMRRQRAWPVVAAIARVPMRPDAEPILGNIGARPRSTYMIKPILNDTNTALSRFQSRRCLLTCEDHLELEGGTVGGRAEQAMVSCLTAVPTFGMLASLWSAKADRGPC